MRKAVLLLLLGCSPSAAPDVLVWARSDDSATLDPAAADWGEDIKIIRTLYEPLVSFKPDSLELEGRLATSWTFSPDGRTADFELREGVLFHDGSPCDAAAVVRSFERLLDPSQSKRPHGRIFRDIAKVEAEGRGVRFTLRRPSAVFLQTLTHFAAGIVSPAMAGTGPYRLGRWERGVKIELDRFERYWGPKPALARIIVVPVASPQTAIEKLRRGEVHVVDHPALSDLAALASDPAIEVLARDAVNVCALGFNMRKPPYDSADLRRAVALAIDRAEIVKLAYHGFGEPASSLVPPLVRGGPAAPYPFDPAAAKAAVLPSRKLDLIHVNIARPYMPEPRRLGELLKEQLRRAGFDVTITTYDKNAYGGMTRSADHPLFILGWHADFPDPDNYYYPLLHGENAGDLNGSHFADPDFDAAVDAARAERDPARRRELYAKADARYRELLPTIPLVHVKQVVAVSRKVEYRMHPMEPRLYAVRFR